MQGGSGNFQLDMERGYQSHYVRIVVPQGAGSTASV